MPKRLPLFCVLTLVFLSTNALAQNPSSPYAVDGLALGSHVDLGTNVYKQYNCGPSEKFSGFTWCHKEKRERTNGREILLSNSILHTEDGTAWYINKYIEPVFFVQGGVRTAIEHLTERFGKQPREFRMPHREGLPDAVIAVWGKIELQELDAAEVSTVASGGTVGGFLVSYLGDLQRSAKAGVPVYRLGGGAGFVWAATFNQYGRGVLRFLASDMSKANPPLIATTDKAVADKTAADNAAAANKAAADRTGTDNTAAENKAAADNTVAENAAATNKAAPEKVVAAPPANDTGLAADRARSNALTPEQSEQAKKLFERAFELLQSGDLQAAQLGFERGLAIDPANGMANFYIAEALKLLGNNLRARIFYNRVIELDADSAEALKARALLGSLPSDFRECATCPEMVVVPAGSFIMGSPTIEQGRYVDEGPQHKVTITNSFAVSKYELTFSEWDACVANGGCNGYRPDDDGWGRERRPVIHVSWDDAKAYVEWITKRTGQPYRLLTEAEYEYAARGGTQTAFPWGNSPTLNGKAMANCSGCGSPWDDKQTAPVGSFPPNKFGLHDMVGNVWEWTEDCYHDNYNGSPSDGSAWTSGDCSRRVVRGGSWGYTPVDLRSANRSGYSTVDRLYYRGFRVGRTLEP